MANLLILMLVAILWFFLLVSGVYMIATRKEHSDRSRLFFGIFSLVSSYAPLRCAAGRGFSRDQHAGH